MSKKTPREPIAGPDGGPEPPYPIELSGRIVRGFGRGSRELGIPTANLPISGLDVGGKKVASGVYYGWATVCLDGAVQASSEASGPVAPSDKEAATAATTTKPATPATTGGPMEFKTYMAVLSIGYNPFYKNEVRSVEVHLVHKFEKDFYNAMMNLSILGYIRPELDYTGLQDLIDDINIDIEVSKKSLDREAYQKRKEDAFLKDFSWEG